jgi:hypothetical protein
VDSLDCSEARSGSGFDGDLQYHLAYIVHIGAVAAQ